jgi:membrane protease YdiL (CAAX protease family)
MGVKGTITLAPPGYDRAVGWARWPVMAPLALLLVALALRVFDIFVLRLDERLGEILLSKTLGFGLVLAYLWWAGQPAASIGFHSRRLGAALALGAGLTAAAFVVAGLAQVLALEPGAGLVIRAVDPKTGLAGGSAFAALLVFGNVVNSLMEEGLFRGIMLTHFLQRWRLGAANLLQAVLFAAWHLVWPLKAYLAGDASAGGAVAQGSSLLLGTFVAALVYGYLFWRTGSLWAPWIAHFLNNTILNLVQVQSASGELQPALLMSVVVVVALALLAFAVGPLARRLGLAPLPTAQAQPAATRRPA